MNRFAVLAEGFEHLSYPLGSSEAADCAAFSERKERFGLHRVQSETDAEIAVGSSDALSEHASLPVGYVLGESGQFFLVCRRNGRTPDARELPDEEKAGLSLSIMRRLAALHSSGLGCGGLSPDAMEFSGREARLLDAGRIFAAGEEDQLFFEAVSTMRSLLGSSFAKKSDFPRLAAAYLSGSPACREAVHSHMRSKGLSGSQNAVLCNAAARYAAYF
jgi:hypothetical protein